MFVIWLLGYAKVEFRNYFLFEKNTNSFVVALPPRSNDGILATLREISNFRGTHNAIYRIPGTIQGYASGTQQLMFMSIW